MEENTGALQNSPSALEAAIASSPEVEQEIQEQQTQDTQTPPAKEGESQEQTEQQETDNVPFHQHPRFKEVIEEKNYFKNLWEQERQRQLSQQQFSQPTQPTQDPYANMTPEEERFWKAVEKTAERVAESKLKQINPVIEAGRMELAQMKVAQFRANHSDVKPNSPEEMMIAEKIQMGYPPDDAYKLVMYDRKLSEAKSQYKQQTEKKIQDKKQANVENSSIPVNTPVSSGNKESVRETAEKYFRMMEEGKL